MLPTGRPLRAGVIGVGYLGRFHAQKYHLIENVQLVGVADADEGSANRVAEALGVRSFTDYHDLLSRVDVVSVATPTSTHYQIGASCLAAGVHLLLEKPMTVRLEEADALVALARRHGRILQVGHLKRFHPAVLALRQSNILKEPRFIESTRFAPFKSRSLDVDVVLDLMIHDVDLILSFVGSEIVEVDAVGTKVVTEHTDVANARLKFQNGCVANVSASRVARSATRRLRLFQKHAFVSLDFAKNDLVVLRKAEGTMQLDGVEVPAMEEFAIPVAKHDTLEVEIRAFCRAAAASEPPLVSGQDGKKALEVIIAIQESIARCSHQDPPSLVAVA
ncbi:MAG: Gfo/Idh/MocA family oxidoreductase [Magnetococcus sp. XQGC-1]